MKRSHLAATLRNLRLRSNVRSPLLVARQRKVWLSRRQPLGQQSKLSQSRLRTTKMTNRDRRRRQELHPKLRAQRESRLLKRPESAMEKMKSPPTSRAADPNHPKEEKARQRVLPRLQTKHQMSMLHLRKLARMSPFPKLNRKTRKRGLRLLPKYGQRFKAHSRQLARRHILTGRPVTLFHTLHCARHSRKSR